MHRDIRWPEDESRVVIMANLVLFMKPLRPATFSSREAVVSLFLLPYGSAGLLPVSVLENCCPDMLMCWACWQDLAMWCSRGTQSHLCP